MTKDEALIGIALVAGQIEFSQGEQSQLYAKRDRLYEAARSKGATRQEIADAAGVSLSAVKATIAARAS